MRTRVTVSIDDAVVVAAEAAVAAGQAPSLSAWVAQAMRERAGRESLADVLAEIRAELGPPTDEETAWARSVLRPPGCRCADRRRARGSAYRPAA